MSHKISVIISCAVLITQFLPNATLLKPGSTQRAASWIKERTFIFTEAGFNTGSCFLNWRKNIYLYRSRVQHKELLLELKKEHLSLPKPGSTQGAASWIKERTFIFTEAGFNTGNCFLNWGKNIYHYLDYNWPLIKHCECFSYKCIRGNSYSEVAWTSAKWLQQHFWFFW